MHNKSKKISQHGFQLIFFSLQFRFDTAAAWSFYFMGFQLKMLSARASKQKVEPFSRLCNRFSINSNSMASELKAFFRQRIFAFLTFRECTEWNLKLLAVINLRHRSRLPTRRKTAFCAFSSNRKWKNFNFLFFSWNVCGWKKENKLQIGWKSCLFGCMEAKTSWKIISFFCSSHT